MNVELVKSLLESGLAREEIQPFATVWPQLNVECRADQIQKAQLN